MDRIVGTGLFALLTADTAVRAVLSYRGAGVVVRALDNNAGGIIDEVNDAVGADACANSAANALFGIDVSNAVFNADRIFGTYVHTVTVAKAGIGAMSVAAVCEVRGATGLLSDVIVLFLYNVTGAVAGNVCYLFNDVLCLYSEGCGDILCRTVSAGSAKVGSGFATVCKSLCIAVASGISASPTVCTGKAVTDSNKLFILFNSKEDVGNGKENGTKNADAREDQNSK